MKISLNAYIKGSTTLRHIGITCILKFENLYSIHSKLIAFKTDTFKTLGYITIICGASLLAQRVKNLPAMQKTQV